MMKKELLKSAAACRLVVQFRSGGSERGEVTAARLKLHAVVDDISMLFTESAAMLGSRLAVAV